MKKITTLRDQVRQARRQVESWPEWLKVATRLEGTDGFLRSDITSSMKKKVGTESTKQKKGKAGG
jgi:hypothetical protein